MVRLPSETYEICLRQFKSIDFKIHHFQQEIKRKILIIFFFNFKVKDLSCRSLAFVYYPLILQESSIPLAVRKFLVSAGHVWP